MGSTGEDTTGGHQGAPTGWPEHSLNASDPDVTSSDSLVQAGRASEMMGTSPQVLRLAIKRGFLQGVRVPSFCLQNPRRWVTTMSEVTAYRDRRKRWRRTYMRSLELVDLLGIEKTTLKPYKTVWPIRAMRADGQHLGVAIPAACEFENLEARHYWHRGDAMLFREWILASAAGRLRQAPADRWCRETGMWHPPYIEMHGDDIEEGYTVETIRRRSAASAWPPAPLSAPASP